MKDSTFSGLFLDIMTSPEEILEGSQSCPPPTLRDEHVVRSIAANSSKLSFFSVGAEENFNRVYVAGSFRPCLSDLYPIEGA